VTSDARRARRFDPTRLATEQRVRDDPLTDTDASYGGPDLDDVAHVLMAEDERERRERRCRRTRLERDDVQVTPADPAEPSPDSDPPVARERRLGNLPNRGARMRADIQTPR